VTAATGIITTIAGNGTAGFGGDGGSAIAAMLNRPTGVYVDNAQNVYVADFGNQRIRKIASGIITTIAGDGTGGFSGDGGLAASAKLHWPSGVYTSAVGDVFIADFGNNRVRKIDITSGMIDTIAGGGASGYLGDGGPATQAILDEPAGVAVTSSNDLYIADSLNHRIRNVSNASGIISTVAGNGIGTYAGDGGLALSASFNTPSDVVLDASGNIFIADTMNNRIRKVDKATGVVTTVAGTGMQGYGGDGGQASSARFYQPAGIFIDGMANLYIADTWNHRVRKVNAATGVVTTVAGNGMGEYAGDGGSALSASLFAPVAYSWILPEISTLPIPIIIVSGRYPPYRDYHNSCRNRRSGMQRKWRLAYRCKFVSTVRCHARCRR